MKKQKKFQYLSTNVRKFRYIPRQVPPIASTYAINTPASTVPTQAKELQVAKILLSLKHSRRNIMGQKHSLKKTAR